MAYFPKEDRQKHYFSPDGNYGDATGLVVIDTEDWSPADWDYIEGLSEGRRAEVAEDLEAGRGSLDFQDCTVCTFTGSVFRRFVDMERGEDGGYTWTCPQCESVHDWEGVDTQSA